MTMIRQRKRRCKQSALTLVCVFAATVPALQATTELALSPAPIVTGNVISVAEDGWYQFQRADTFEELCSGTFQCSVTSGSYIVVNHSNQQRWEPVVVGAESTSVLVVDGLTFKFPDNGWYQVQDSITYQSVCNGLRVCDVPEGSYNVINHSVAQRWDSVVVSEADDINTILLPDNDWYQVQSSTGLTSFCEGVSQCRVAAGTYNVINHSNGNRYDGVQVGETSLDPMPSFTLSVANAEEVVRNVISVINEDQIDAFFSEAQNDMDFQGRLFFLTNTVDEISFAQGVDLDTPYQLETNYGEGTFTDIPVRSEYTCAAGGTIYNYFKDRVFNDCVVGNNTYNGISGRRNDDLRGSIRDYPFWNFSATNSAGVTSTLTGGYSTGNLSFVVLNQTQRWVDASFTTTLTDGGFSLQNFTIERLDRSDLGTSFEDRTQVIDGVAYTIRNNSQSSSIDGSFTVQAGWTNQQLLDVSVALSFSDTVRELTDSSLTDYPGTLDPREPFHWQAGTVEIMAADGTALMLVPTLGSNQSFSINLSNGESIGPLLWSDGYSIDCGSDTICGE